MRFQPGDRVIARRDPDHKMEYGGPGYVMSAKQVSYWDCYEVQLDSGIWWQFYGSRLVREPVGNLEENGKMSKFKIGDRVRIRAGGGDPINGEIATVKSINSKGNGYYVLVDSESYEPIYFAETELEAVDSLEGDRKMKFKVGDRIIDKITLTPGTVVYPIGQISYGVVLDGNECSPPTRLPEDDLAPEPTEPCPENDIINHPSHYTAYKGIEVIQLTEQLNFNRGNAVKYIARAGLKNKDTEVEDLKKSLWYLQREIERISNA